MSSLREPLAGALLAVAATLALAQSGEEPSPEQSPPAQNEASAAPESEASESTDSGVVLSPFDYEASESISEDASVSFPIDI
jgi:hypothetical protein